MSLFDCPLYTIGRKIALGTKFTLTDPSGAVIGFCHQKAFKLKEDIRIYTDDSKSTELVNIQAQQVIDFAAKYDVKTPQDDKNWGVWQRKGFESIVRDTWQYTSPDGEEMTLEEDSVGMALLRRFLCSLVPQSFVLKSGNEVIAEFKQHFNPFIFKMDVKLVSPKAQSIAPAIAAGAILLCAIEGRQQ